MQQDRKPMGVMDRAGHNPFVWEERSLCRERLARRSLWTQKIDLPWLKGVTKWWIVLLEGGKEGKCWQFSEIHFSYCPLPYYWTSTRSRVGRGSSGQIKEYLGTGSWRRRHALEGTVQEKDGKCSQTQLGLPWQFWRISRAAFRFVKCSSAAHVDKIMWHRSLFELLGW